jgi:hypothetical protein
MQVEHLKKVTHITGKMTRMGAVASPRGDGDTKKLQLHQGQMVGGGGDIGKRKLQEAYSFKT